MTQHTEDEWKQGNITYNRHEDNTKQRRGRTRRGRLVRNIQIFGLLHGIHQRQHTGVGGGVTKSR